MFLKLQGGRKTLVEIGGAYPDLTYSLDLLSNALTRISSDETRHCGLQASELSDSHLLTGNRFWLAAL